MSYTLQLWEKPADWPWPGTKAEADAQFERMQDSPPPGQNPKFLAFGQALYERFPPEMDAWLDGSEEGVTEDATLGFGLLTGSPHWDAAFDHAWEQAGRLGLNLYDPQSGVHYLGNGDVPEEPDLEVQRAVRARKAGDDRAAWAEYRRLAARGNPHALYAMGRALRFGVMDQRRHFDLAAALQLLGAHDAGSRQDAKGFHDRFPPEGQARVQMLLARMKSSGELLLKIVDGERQAVDDAFERAERLMLDSRKCLEASDGLEALALQGHEVAAYRQVLESVIGWEEPNFENARYWCQRAADWDHEPAKRLLALMHERGWGGPVDLALAAKWHAAAQEQRQPQQKRDVPGGLSLEPKPSASAPSTGSVMRDFVGWIARDGNPHAAYHMGTSDQHGRHGGPADMAQARAWYAQAAEAGHADATYNLAIFVEEGTGGPKDALAGKALFMLAHARGSTMRAEGLRVSASDQGTVRALVTALREPGRLRSVLQERGAAAGGGGRGSAARAAGGSAAAAVAASPAGQGVLRDPSSSSSAPTTGRARPRVEEPDDSDEPDGPYRIPMSWHLGHLALAIGAANAVLLIAFVKPGASFRAGMLVLGLVAAFGAWRTSRDFEWRPVARALVALLAAIPMVGMAVSVGLLFKAFRTRG